MMSTAVLRDGRARRDYRPIPLVPKPPHLLTMDIAKYALVKSAHKCETRHCVVIKQLPEMEFGHTLDRMAFHFDTVYRMLSFLSIDAVVVQTFRMGTFNPNRPRALKVVLSNSHAASAFVRASKTMRWDLYMGDAYRRVFVRPSFETQEDRVNYETEARYRPRIPPERPTPATEPKFPVVPPKQDEVNNIDMDETMPALHDEEPVEEVTPIPTKINIIIPPKSAATPASSKSAKKKKRKSVVFTDRFGNIGTLSPSQTHSPGGRPTAKKIGLSVDPNRASNSPLPRTPVRATGT